jgi:PAS domain S-box-containing protein
MFRSPGPKSFTNADENKYHLIEARRPTVTFSGRALITGLVKSKSAVPATEIQIDLKDVLDALPFYALLIDEKHQILYANSQVRTHLGVEPVDVVGRYCPEVIHGLKSPFPGCPLEESVEKGKGVEREFYDPKIKQWLLSAVYPTPAFSPEGNRVYFHMVTDITARKQAEKGLTRSHEKLRHLSGDLESLREEERRKIARDLHDETSQLLASLSAHLQAAIGTLPKSSDRVRKELKRAQSLSIDIIDQLQRITYELRPLVLDDLGLVPAIGWLVDKNLKKAGIKVKFNTLGEMRRLDRQVETTVFRIIQEAVSNIIRHSKARNVELLLRYTKKRIAVTISDDGKGFSQKEVIKKREGMRGLGLLGMKERIELVNGRFSLSSRADSGTKIVFSIPLA